MKKKIFISQSVLDTLFAEGGASLDGDRLTIHAKGGQVFKLAPAYKFLHLVEGQKDPNGLVGKIFTTTELEKIKADIYMDSVLIKEIAYQVEPGFVGRPETASSTEPAQAEATEDLLEDYLLKIL